jgi:hypothetical protein
VALRAYLAGDEPNVDETLQSGTEMTDGSVAACVAAGLRRLPTLRGPVYRGAPLDAVEPPLCEPRTVLEERAFVQASSSKSAVFETDAEYIIWSQSGRRTAILELDGDCADAVFAPGTQFVVTGVRNFPRSGDEASAGRPQVLLVEVPPGQEAAKVADGVVTQLERAAQARDAVQLDPTVASTPGCTQAFTLSAHRDLAG